jgi:hypothetical protein
MGVVPSHRTDRLALFLTAFLGGAKPLGMGLLTWY